MNVLDTRRYEMLMRVRDFGAAQKSLFPAKTLAGQMMATITATVQELSQHAASQASGVGAAREATSSKAASRATLRDDLDAISRTARALAIDIPGLDDKFCLPRGQSDQLLLSVARAFAQDAAPLADDFIKHEMPATFLDDLHIAINNFEKAFSDHVTGKETHVAASAGIDAAMEKGVLALQRLDAIVHNKLHDHRAMLSAWQRACHVERSRGRAKAAAANDGTTGAASPQS